MGAAWSSAPWERAEHLLAPAHALLVDRLAPRSGEDWLDVATGAGAVARRAARAGARTTGVDLAAGLIASAQRLAREEGLDISFAVSDAEALPYADRSFDAVSSSMGMIFAPDHRAVAREVTRVCRPGGRLGFTAWRPEVGFSVVTRRFQPPLPPEAGDSDEWGREEYIESLLGEAFELEISEHSLDFTGESGEAIWSLLTEAVGPIKTLSGWLEPERAEELHRELVAYLEDHREDGGIRLPAGYLLVLGRLR
jgi:SAM-dependent methyltransferase